MERLAKLLVIRERITSGLRDQLSTRVSRAWLRPRPRQHRRRIPALRAGQSPTAYPPSTLDPPPRSCSRAQRAVRAFAGQRPSSDHTDQRVIVPPSAGRQPLPGASLATWCEARERFIPAVQAWSVEQRKNRLLGVVAVVLGTAADALGILIALCNEPTPGDDPTSYIRLSRRGTPRVVP